MIAGRFFTCILAASVVAGAWLTASPASAALFCEVMKTSDGFVALRAGPDRNAKLVARMKAGDEYLLDGGIEPKNGWHFATWWRGGRYSGVAPHGVQKASNGKGWVHKSLLADMCG